MELLLTGKVKYAEYILLLAFVGHKIGIIHVSDCQAYVWVIWIVGITEMERKVYWLDMGKF